MLVGVQLQVLILTALSLPVQCTDHSSKHWWRILLDGWHLIGMISPVLVRCTVLGSIHHSCKLPHENLIYRKAKP